MTRNYWIYEVVCPLFNEAFTENVLNKACYNNNDYVKQITRFKTYIQNEGLHLVEISADSLNCRRYNICLFEEDKDGFRIQKTICVFRYVTGIYGGALVQLKDDNNLNICSKGHIR